MTIYHHRPRHIQSPKAFTRYFVYTRVFQFLSGLSYEPRFSIASCLGHQRSADRFKTPFTQSVNCCKIYD